MLLTVHMHNIELKISLNYGVNTVRKEVRVLVPYELAPAELTAFNTRSLFVLANHILIETKKIETNKDVWSSAKLNLNYPCRGNER